MPLRAGQMQEAFVDPAGAFGLCSAASGIEDTDGPLVWSRLGERNRGRASRRWVGTRDSGDPGI